MLRKLLLFFVCVICLQFNLQAQTVTLSTLEWEPYIGPNMKNNGYVHELVIKAFEKAGVTATAKYYPWARALKLATGGETDGLFPEYYDESRLNDFVFSDPFPGGPVGLYKRKELNVAYSHDPQLEQEAALLELADYRFGVVRGYINTKVFDEAQFLKKEAANDDATNLRKLFKKRLDFIFIDKYVAKHIIVREFPHYLADLEFMEPALENKSLYIVFSKQAPNYQESLALFNEGLKLLKESGEMEQIMASHGF